MLTKYLICSPEFCHFLQMTGGYITRSGQWNMSKSDMWHFGAEASTNPSVIVYFIFPCFGDHGSMRHYRIKASSLLSYTWKTAVLNICWDIHNWLQVRKISWYCVKSLKLWCWFFLQHHLGYTAWYTLSRVLKCYFYRFCTFLVRLVSFLLQL